MNELTRSILDLCLLVANGNKSRRQVVFGSRSSTQSKKGQRESKKDAQTGWQSLCKRATLLAIHISEARDEIGPRFRSKSGTDGGSTPQAPPFTFFLFRGSHRADSYEETRKSGLHYILDRKRGVFIIQSPRAWCWLFYEFSLAAIGRWVPPWCENKRRVV
jgi:hypothetical protein